MSRLPAFAKAIVKERDLGRHPGRIFVLFGFDWARRPAGSVCVKPGEYSPGAYDWSWTAGIEVYIVERDHVDIPDRDAARLAVDVAKRTAPVFLCWQDQHGTHKTDIADFMAESQRNKAGWSKRQEELYLQRRQAHSSAWGRDEERQPD